MNKEETEKFRAKLDRKLKAIKPKINRSIKRMNEQTLERFNHQIALIDELLTLFDEKEIKDKELNKAKLLQVRIFVVSQKKYFEERLKQDLID
jgi:hypothetical protein